MIAVPNGKAIEEASPAETGPLTDAELLRNEFIATQEKLNQIKLHANLRGIDLTDPEEEKFFTPITAAELDAGNFELSYLVDGVIAERQPLIIAGQFKTLKTSIAFDLAVSLASATTFLGRFPTQCRRVMVLTAESGMATVQETCRRICKQKQIELSGVQNLVFCDRVPSLVSPTHTNELIELMKKFETEVLIADPAYLMIDGENAGNLFAMGTQLRAFAELALKSGATPVLLHHAKKNNLNATDYQPLELADLAWAGFAEFARQWLLLSRRERYIEGSGDHRLWMSVGGSAGHNGCWGLDISEGHPSNEGGRVWCVEIDGATAIRQTAEEQRQEAKEAKKERDRQRKLEKDMQRLRDAFIGVGTTGISKSAAFTKAGLNPASGLAALGRLLTDKVVESCTVRAANKQEYEGYRLIDDRPDKDSDEGWV